MTAAQFFLLLVPAAALLLYALAYLVANRNAPVEAAPEGKPLTPEEERRRRLRRFYTRAMFVFWTLFLVLHRALAIWLAVVSDSSIDPGVKEGAGMTLVFVDPYGILLVLGGSLLFRNLTGAALIPDKDLTAFYIVGSAFIDGLIVWFLWRCSRRAFLRPAPAKEKGPV